jgi:intein-encoded DNA endonuclease-like protein
VPSLHPEDKGKEFSMESSERYKKYLEKNKDALKAINFDMGQRRFVLNFINGKRSVVKIRSSVAAETGRDVDFNALVKYLEFLKAVGWIVY